MTKKSQADQMMAFFNDHPNQFLSCSAISNFFPGMATKSVSAVLSKLFTQGLIKRSGNAYGIGQGGWFHGHEPTPRKKCPSCETIKMLYSFPKNTSCEDGRTDICRLCTNQLPKGPPQDLLVDLLAAMPATLIQGSTVNFI